MPLPTAPTLTSARSILSRLIFWKSSKLLIIGILTSAGTRLAAGSVYSAAYMCTATSKSSESCALHNEVGFLPRKAGKGDHAKHGGRGPMRSTGKGAQSRHE